MIDTSTAIENEKKAFNARLADMLKDHGGEYVVFKDGEPAGFFPDASAAYGFAMDKYGPDAGFLIRQVAPARLEVSSLTWHLGLSHAR